VSDTEATMLFYYTSAQGRRVYRESYSYVSLTVYYIKTAGLFVKHQHSMTQWLWFSGGHTVQQIFL